MAQLNKKYCKKCKCETDHINNICLRNHGKNISWDYVKKLHEQIEGAHKKAGSSKLIFK